MLLTEVGRALQLFPQLLVFNVALLIIPLHAV